MKLKIKVKLFGDQVLPEMIKTGDWIDLRYYGPTVHINAGGYCLLSLGMSVKLPEGFEAIVASRSSTYKNFGIYIPGGIGIIDGSYCGDMDIWQYPAYALKDKVTIKSGDRICQFRIQLSQKATFWQKLKWFFSNGKKIEQVEHLNTINRGGVGSTGKR